MASMWAIAVRSPAAELALCSPKILVGIGTTYGLFNGLFLHVPDLPPVVVRSLCQTLGNFDPAPVIGPA
jgi:predicted ABC-type sugar transport system permease subunit